MGVRTQQESEQPAKVYQLDAVESKVDTALSKLDTLISQTSGLVTTSELSETEKRLNERIEEKIQEAEEKIHLEYGPLKRNTSKLLWIIIAAALSQLVGVAFTFYNWMSKQ